MSDWGKFTAKGGDEVERFITQAMKDAARALETSVGPRLRSAVLLGGYGRGEGGVDRSDGRERPHNNFDFLLITHGSEDLAAIKEEASVAVDAVRVSAGVEIDIGCISAERLSSAESLVMWYDMRFGHKTLLGERDFVAGLTQFSKDSIPAWDVRNLLVNRATLLVINELLLNRKQALSQLDRRTIIKHCVKAIIGYGDAILYSIGEYHWSYVEKQTRMQRCEAAAVQGIKSVYEEAMNFRFEPDYEGYATKDLARWNAELLKMFAPVHLAFEQHRLEERNLSWEEYPEAAFRASVMEGGLSLRPWARKVVSTARSIRTNEVRLSGRRARLGFRSCGERGRLPIVFPVVAYDLEEEQFRGLAMDVLEATTGDDIMELRRAYLRAWATHGDPNFPAVMAKLGLSIARGDVS